jgi:hypothetical protein
MRIANPICGVVFKYLLDDQKAAQLMLSALLGKDVPEVGFRPAELRQPVAQPDGTQRLALRLDFTATVRLEDGSRKPGLRQGRVGQTSRIHANLDPCGERRRPMVKPCVDIGFPGCADGGRP